MAPTKGKDTLLELCTTSVTLGNSVAVHLLDYLSIAPDPPHGFNKVAVEFLETSRVLIPARTGLTEAARSSTQLPAHTTNDLRQRFSQINNAFTVLDQVVTRYLASERKSGFGKFGKGFRMMFADSEIEKLRQSLAQCREALAKSPQVQTWTLGECQIEPAAGIGYTALAAVLDRPDPTRGKAPSEIRQKFTATDTARELPLPPPEPILGRYTTSTSSRLDMPSPHLPASPVYERERTSGHAFSRETGSTSTASHTFGSRSSTAPLHSDDLSEITAATSIAETEEMMHTQDLNDRMPKQPLRVTVDPTKVPRWTPTRTGTVSAGSKAALLAAVQQQNHNMVEQLLDCGVPPHCGERNLLTVAIVNHDFTTFRLLLAFGSDPNAKEKDGFTPLFSATQASFFEAAQLLLKVSSAGYNPSLRHVKNYDCMLRHPLTYTLPRGSTVRRQTSPLDPILRIHSLAPSILIKRRSSTCFSNMAPSLMRVCMLLGIIHI